MKLTTDEEPYLLGHELLSAGPLPPRSATERITREFTSRLVLMGRVS
jgi:hypothetical protein